MLAVGTELAPSDLWNGALPLTGRLVRIDIDPVGIVTNAAPDVALVGDSARVLADLLVALPAQPASAEPSDLPGWRDRKTADAEREGSTWLPLVRALSAALPRDVVLATDNAMFCYYGMMSNLPVYEPSSYLFPTGYGTLGYGLPAAIGAKVGNPDRPAVAVLPVHAVTFDAPDFAALGRSLGCLGTTLDDPVELTAAVTSALAADRPTVIHVRHPERVGVIG